MLLISFSLFTVIYFEGDDFRSGSTSKTIRIEATSMGGDGYYDTRIEPGFSPGTYRVTIYPIGKNVTIWIRSYSGSVEKNFNRSNNKETSFKIKIDSAVWQGILVGDAPDLNFSLEQKTLKIEYRKIEEGWKTSTWILLGISGAGGVTFAANEARIYRKKRQ